MARTISIRRDASALDDIDYQDGQVSGGKELIDALLQELRPTISGQASKFVGGRRGRSADTVHFFESISGAPKNSTKYTNARRNFQRAVKGRKTKIETLEGYSAHYELANGERSPEIDQLILAAGGSVPDDSPVELPEGDLSIEVYATIQVVTGRKGKKQTADVRDRSPGVIHIPSTDIDYATGNPLSAWQLALSVAIPEFLVSDVQWVDLTFTPA